jgi:hypothetical protein
MLIRPFPKLISSFSKSNFDSTFKAAAEYSKFEKVQLSYKNSTIVVIAHNRELSCS